MTALDSADAGPAPLALTASTVNLYVVPLVSPVTVFVVAGGEPVTVVGVCAVVPTYGVIRYEVTGPPPEGAVHVTFADVPPLSVAVTPVTWPGSGSA